MKKHLLTLLTALALPLASQATVHVAVVDSGTDFTHAWLKDRAWINTKEIAGNLVDDDRNGKVDDVYGWNFADNYNQVFVREHLNSVNPETFHIFEIIARIQAGTATEADKKYWNDHVINLPADQKEALVNQLNFYGQYAHSTHCSGIVALMAPNAKIMSARVFPDSPPAPLMASKEQKSNGIIDYIYKMLAAVTNGSFDQVGLYLNERGADVANYSLGMSLQAIAKLSLGIQGNKNPTEEQIAAETRRIAAQYEPAGRKWMASSPHTLFVIAAGNDGSDNDFMPAFPANVKADNAITVAATLGNASLATFSNYGKTTVDIAAPGVAIMSSVPSLDMQQILPMSGTSMAAPYITGVAAQIKEINPKLTPKELKQILMATVDKKEWLAAKVVSGGVVNSKRSFAAAEMSKSVPLAQAISEAQVRVKDAPVADLPTRPAFMNATSTDMKAFANQLVF